MIPDKINPRLPGGFNLPPFGVHQILALIIVCISLWAVGTLWLGMQAASQWVGSWQDDIHIHVYIDGEKSDITKSLEQELASIAQVSSVRRISQEEAARWMQEWLTGGGLEQHELVKRLPVTFELSLTDEKSEFLFADIRDTARRFGAQINEDEVNLAQVHDLLSQVSYLAWFASLILAIAMALIISNTLRMTLLARADEIHLMRLLGAKEWFVRTPFILEGMLLGAGAGVLAWLLLWPVVLGVGGWMATMQVDLNAWVLLLPLLFGGGIVGTLGAVIATARVVSRETSV
ncbi:cell division transport system permease protein [Mariprofundus micogutta]|uniref:Cell division protein FtsX n=2 Tax=Mariprofundus micogutta TaxID=1921010 RepID=A0A1L8CPF6_9PROT|nr:cell division transport system permease protein [Mariprofundus micogutta]